MADLNQKFFLDETGLGTLVTEIKKADSAVLSDAKDYADSLADNYDVAGSAASVQSNLDKEVARAQAAEKVNSDAISAINNAETGILKQAKDYTDAETKKVQDNVDIVDAKVGDLEGLSTTDKDNLVDAINEVRNSVSVGGTASVVTMTTETTTDGYLKSYTLKQGDSTIGVIDIPKDMVVESGEVVVNPEGQAEGTYIKLVLANVTDPLFINVGTLVDIYKAKGSATQVQITIDSSTREISAVIVAGSIGTTELADSAVVTSKIADGNVTKAKLSTAVQASLDKADASASQEALNNAVGTLEGADANLETRIVELEKVDHSHANQTELDLIKSGDKAKWDAAEQNAKDYADGKVTAEATARNEAISTAKGEAITTAGTNADSKIANKVGEIGEVTVKAYVDQVELDAAADAKSKADKALVDAKAYTDQKVGAIDLSGIATNASAIETLASSHANDKSALENADTEMDRRISVLENVTYEAIPVATIQGLFA